MRLAVIALVLAAVTAAIVAAPPARHSTACTPLLDCVGVHPGAGRVTLTADVPPCAGECTAIRLSVRRKGDPRTLGHAALGVGGPARDRFGWDLRLHGRRLAPGRYELRLSALRAGRPVEVSRPLPLTVS